MRSGTIWFGLLFTVCVTLVGSAMAPAATLEILLPISEYPRDETHAFETEDSLLGLQSVRLHLEGESSCQHYVSAFDPWVVECLPASISVELSGAQGSGPVSTVIHTFPDGPTEPFSLDLIFSFADPEDLAAIADGDGALRIQDLAEMYFDGMHYMFPADPPCHVTTAALIFEFDGLVATAETTWGELKSVYR